jgi:hypothetical protein
MHSTLPMKALQSISNEYRRENKGNHQENSIEVDQVEGGIENHLSETVEDN